MKRILMLARILIKGSDLMSTTGMKRKKQGRRGGSIFSRFGRGRSGSLGTDTVEPVADSAAAPSRTVPTPTWKKVGKALLFVLLGAYMLGVFGVLGYSMGGTVGIVPLESMVLNIMGMLCFMQSLFGLFYVVSVFYHSDDIHRLLALPLRPHEIVAAKYLQSLLYTGILPLFMTLPMLVGIGIAAKLSATYFVMSVLVVFFLMVVPLATSSIFSMLIMRFFRFARNKDLMSMIINGIVMLGGIAMGLYGSFMGSSMSDDGVMPTGSVTVGALEFVGRYFPGGFFGARAIAAPDVGEQILNLFLLILIAVGATAIVFALAAKIYFPGVLGVGTTPAKRRALSDREKSRLRERGSARRELLLKEWRTLFRSPTYFLNLILPSLLVPIIMIVSGGISLSQVEREEGGFSLQDIIGSALGSPEFLNQSGWIILMSVLCFAFFIAAMNGIASTAVSREGNAYYILKLLPIRASDIMLSKLAIGQFVSLVTIAAFLFMIMAILPLPLSVWLPCLIIFILASLSVNAVGLYIDLRRPYLEWTNEQMAAKSNINYLIAMGFSMLFAGIAVGLTYLIRYFIIPSYTGWIVIYCGYMLLTTVGIFVILFRSAPERVRRLGEV